ncbi:MAG: hypothetical protein RIS83_1510 [Pseudomonadota bacterium]
MQPRGDDACIIHHHDIARAKQGGQIKHASIFPAIRAHHQHARGITRADGRLRDQLLRQGEIIISQPERGVLGAHGAAVARPRLGRNWGNPYMAPG